MTIAIAWVGARSDGAEHLYFASDSRTRGCGVFDQCPKILTLPRSDSAICFAGDVAWSYPFMVQLLNAIAAHYPSRSRQLDITQLKDHLIKIATSLVGSIMEPMEDFDYSSATFIFGGYSWRKTAFCVWILSYDTTRKTYVARTCNTFHPNLKQAAFIGDWSRRFRGRVYRAMSQPEENGVHAELRPLIELSLQLKECDRKDTIGGAPQVVRIGVHMNTRPFCVEWGTPPVKTIFGRPLLSYENCDYWSIDPIKGLIKPPDAIGQRNEVGLQ